MDMTFINSGEQFCDLLNDLLKIATRRGADAAEAEVSESIQLDVAVRCGALDSMDISRGQGLSLTVYVNGKSGSASTATLTPEALQTVSERALAIARATSADPCAGLADKELMATEFPDLQLYHQWDITPEKAIALAQRSEEASWAAHADVNREKSNGAALNTSYSLAAYANTHGFCAAEKTSVHTIACGAVAEKDGAMETDGWSETRRNAAQLPPAEQIGTIAGEYAVRRLGGGKIQNCRVPVLFQAPAAHSLIRHFVGAASGGALYRNTSFLHDKLGERIFAEHISIRELPHLPEELASSAYDDDGVATQPRDIIKDGVWNGRFLSAYSARKLGTQTTGNAGGAHNLEVSGDSLSAAELPARLGRGLIVTTLMGQGVNTVTGDYSRGAAGFWVENGEIVYPVSGITIAGNLLKMLSTISVVGDDTMRRGTIKCGSLLIPELTIGDNQ